MTRPMRGAVMGAGIARISMAHALRRIGLAIDLFEQSPAPRSTGYQLNVHANGKYALAQIGLGDAVEQSPGGAAVNSAPPSCRRAERRFTGPRLCAAATPATSSARQQSAESSPMTRRRARP